MTYDDDTPEYAAIAARLDRLQPVPTDFLTTVVVRRGLCLWGLWPAQDPDWEDCAPGDRALAERLCEGCPVINQCLELELRKAGASTTGVWGALPEDDRRALHRVWQRRRHQHDGTGQDRGRSVSVHCDQCGDALGGPLFQAHFRTETAALDAAATDGWRAGPGERWVCSACAPVLTCDAEGHDFSTWRHPLTVNGQPARSEYRYCLRCCQFDSRPATPNHQDRGDLR